MRSLPQATRYLRLALDFHLPSLQRDLHSLLGCAWFDHYNQQAHQGRWTCLPLRAPDGQADNIMAEAGVPFADTPLLAHCPYFRQVLSCLACETTSARLMSLAPGGRILPHTDRGGAYEDGVARLHIPIVTDPAVCFTIDGETVHFAAGAAWYMNANCLHAVHNGSARARIHLVIDCVPNPWLQDLFERAGWIPNPAPKYGDHAIDDDNVGALIAALRAAGGSVPRALADRLASIHGGAVHPLPPAVPQRQTRRSTPWKHS